MKYQPQPCCQKPRANVTDPEYQSVPVHCTHTCEATRVQGTVVQQEQSAKRCSSLKCFGPSCIPITIVIILIIIVISLPFGDYRRNNSTKARLFESDGYASEIKCDIQIAESIPDGLNFTDDSPKFLSTFEAWKTLLDAANDSINIGSFYWTLRGVDVVNHSTANQGEEIFHKILSNGNTRKLKIRIAQSEGPNADTEEFVKNGAADVRSVNFPRLLGNGVLHTKVWVVDNQHFYLGSANMDWRSLTQVKEVGVLAQNCPTLALDVNKIFEAYWYLGVNTSTIPKKWPEEFSTKYNLKNPMLVNFNNRFEMSALFSNSPPLLSANGRDNDLEAVLNTISTAKSFVNIAVMDYFPLLIYTKHIRYWPLIDDALRTAAIERGVSIKMLISWWKHSRSSEDFFLRSLTVLSSSMKGVDIQVKRFVVPANKDQSKIPFSRVNHNKYMVTDKTAYIGTSNWSGDYFTNTAGIGLVLGQLESKFGSSKNLRTDLLSLFERDWNSPYAVELSIYDR